MLKETHFHSAFYKDQFAGLIIIAAETNLSSHDRNKTGFFK